MLVKEIMTRNPACCTPADTLQSAARLMSDQDCGSLPVVEGSGRMKVVGVLTDRDIAVRGVARGKLPSSKVNDVMTPSPACCSPEDEIDEVEQIMIERQVRRVPVVDSENRVVGMIAQADLARNNSATSDREVGRIVEKISAPAFPHRAAREDTQPEQRL